jgi:hypothetical protein
MLACLALDPAPAVHPVVEWHLLLHPLPSLLRQSLWQRLEHQLLLFLWLVDCWQ